MKKNVSMENNVIPLESELKKMDKMESFNIADRLGWFQYVSILTYKFYGLPGCNDDNQWHSVCLDFWGRYMRGDIKQEFTKEDYLNNIKIIKSIKSFGLDVDKFWLLLLFIYDYVFCHLSKGLFVDESSEVVFSKKLIAQLSKCKLEEVNISIKIGKKSVRISEVGKKAILRMLYRGYENTYSQALGYDIPFSGGLLQLSMSYHMKWAVELYEYTFNYLDKEWHLIHPHKLPNASLNRMLLFSRIMYFYGWTDNKSFLESDDSLRGILNAYKNKPIPRTCCQEYF